MFCISFKHFVPGVVPPYALTSGSTTRLEHSPCHKPPPTLQVSWIALSATLKDLSATPKSRENTDIGLISPEIYTYFRESQVSV